MGRSPCVDLSRVVGIGTCNYERIYDRIFLPGFAFQKKEDTVWWYKYLTGRTARLICTLDQPAMKKMTLNFLGIKKVSITTIGPIRLSKDEYREKWLTKMETLGKGNK